MKSLKYTIPVALAVWWIPILNGIIVGAVAGFSERRRDTSMVSSGVASLIGSALYLYLAFKVLVVPIFGNLLPVLAVIFSIVGISWVFSHHTRYLTGPRFQLLPQRELRWSFTQRITTK